MVSPRTLQRYCRLMLSLQVAPSTALGSRTRFCPRVGSCFPPFSTNSSICSSNSFLPANFQFFFHKTCHFLGVNFARLWTSLIVAWLGLLSWSLYTRVYLTFLWSLNWPMSDLRISDPNSLQTSPHTGCISVHKKCGCIVRARIPCQTDQASDIWACMELNQGSCVSLKSHPYYQSIFGLLMMRTMLESLATRRRIEAKVQRCARPLVNGQSFLQSLLRSLHG